MQTIAFKSGSDDPNLNLSIIFDMACHECWGVSFSSFFEAKCSQGVRKYKQKPSANDEALSCLFLNGIKIYYVHAHHAVSVSPQ